jgi:hypothetical protein
MFQFGLNKTRLISKFVTMTAFTETFLHYTTAPTLLSNVSAPSFVFRFFAYNPHSST